MSEEAASSQRLDKWLWFARFFKTRSLATRSCAAGRLRVNDTRIVKAHHGLRVGDVVTFAKGPEVRVVRVLGLGERRGPATEARLLYADLEPPGASEDGGGAARRPRGGGRPTKAERRAIDRLRPER